MGEVYRGRDTRLRRDVAIKVLPPPVLADPTRRKRFEVEARAIAALSHPHICPIHDVGAEGELQYLVLELVQGETLAARLKRGPMPLAEALARAVEMADAMATAHRRGIIHRDLKPGNVMLTKAGAVILDFGLARIVRDDPAATSDPAQTATAPLTEAGLVLGTLQYMAPEQIESRPTDARTDVFAFGAVLFEMLTSRRAFDGSSAPAVMGAILRADAPSAMAVQPALPSSVDRVIRTCLAKDPADRLASMQDVKVALGWIQEDTSGHVADRPAARATRGRTRGPLVAVAIALVALAGAAAGAWGWAQFGARSLPPAGATTVAMEVAIPDGTNWSSGLHPAISNDGARIALVADRGAIRQLYVRSVNDVTLRLLPGTDGALQPFFAPDGREIAFFADQQLKVISIDGGPARVVCDAASPRGGFWGDDNVIVFAGDPQSGLSRVAAIGGTPEPLTTLRAGESSHRFPYVLPGAAGVVFTLQRADGSYSIGVVAPRTRQHAVAVQAARSPSFAGGRLLYVNDHSEWAAVPFDLAALRVVGPVSVQPERSTGGSYLGDSGFSVSRDGTLAYLPYEAPLKSMGVIDRTGRFTELPGPPRDFQSPHLSRDGRRVVVNVAGVGLWGDIWIGDLAGSLMPLTHDGLSRFPAWSPEGDRVAFESLRLGQPAVFVQQLAGNAQAVQVTEAGVESLPSSWTGDGKVLQLSTSNLRPGFEGISTLRLGQTSPFSVPAAVPLPVTKTAYGRVSSDGRWLAYTTNESGEWEMFLTSFPAPGAVRSISKGGSGREMVWAPSGNDLYFRRVDGHLLAVTIGLDGTPGPLRPVNTGDLPFSSAGAGAPHYDVFPDGRILALKTVSARQRIRPVVVVVNWLNGLAKK
jgi:serine/threonine-protein kinase